MIDQSKEIAWALVQMLDGVKRYELPDYGFSEEVCDRIWAAKIEAQKILANNDKT
jgi:hypothetical protein